MRFGSFSWLFSSSLVLAGGLVQVTGCGEGNGSTVGTGAASGGGSRNVGGSRNFGGALNLSEGGDSTQPSSGGGDGSECSADFATAELKPVHLSFALDVSGSMGKLDFPYHNPELKWRPVISALGAFFEDSASSGISASLTFFPAEDDRCDAETYVQPDVAITELPSAAFGAAITVIDPDRTGEWRGGTPTLAVVEGSFDYLTGLIEAVPDAQHALVLVTDGYPQGCDDEADEIDGVVDVIEQARSRFPTYVIGVKNPEGGPDTVTDLDRLAVAGGTEPAIFIDTGNPTQTAADLSDAIARIRERSAACDAAIPPAPGGSPFNPSKVNVSMDRDGVRSQLGYDETCEEEAAWRYDDADAPSAIVLCPTTCDIVQQNPSVTLDVEFGCDTRPVVR